MHYLVTGGTGFIGSYVVRDLLDAGHTVTAYDLAPNPEHMRTVVGDSDAEGVEVVRGDVQDMALLLRTMQRTKTERVVHLAATLGAGSEDNALRTLNVNCVGTLNVFECALANEVDKVVWGSSIAVFGPTGERPPGIANDAYHAPVRLYGACKSLLERFSVHYRRERSLDCVGLRFSIVYGFGKSLSVTRGSRADHLLALIDAPALEGRSVVPWGDDVQNLVYVEDAARAVLLASDTSQNPSVGLNVCGSEVRISDAADIVRGILPDADIRVEGGLRGGSEGYDMTTTEREIGYAPIYDLEEGFRRNINMLREQHGLAPV